MARIIAVRKCARLTTAARVDCIGRIQSRKNGRVVLLVPNWQADGWPKEFYCGDDELAPATTKEMRDAAARR